MPSLLRLSIGFFVAKEEEIEALVGLTGKPGADAYRDNNVLSDVFKELKTRIPADSKTNGPGKANFVWPGKKNL